MLWKEIKAWFGATTFVKIPKQEKLSPAGCRTANMTKQIDTWVPEHTIKAQHNLKRRKKWGSKKTYFIFNVFHFLGLCYVADDRHMDLLESISGLPYLIIRKPLNYIKTKFTHSKKII